MQVRIFYHHQCFDGAASAAYLGRFFSEVAFPTANLQLVPVVHAPASPWDSAQFNADENAIVDFTYANDPRVTWWFDHHESAFMSAPDKSAYLASADERKVWDTGYHSCARLIESVLEARFHYRAEDLRPLVNWADVIDGALYDAPADAARFDRAPLQLMLVLDHAEANRSAHLVRQLMSRSIESVAQTPEVQDSLKTLHGWHQDCAEAIARESRLFGGVIYCDLRSYGFHRYPKFIPYTVFPNGFFTVVLLETGNGVKVSVGANPWKPMPGAPSLAALCERHGGGGHPFVGAVTLPHGQIERARTIAWEFVSRLQQFTHGPAAT